jgi:hypothetical protein
VNILDSLYQKNLSIQPVSLKHTVDGVVTIGKKRNYDFQKSKEANKYRQQRRSAT